MHDSLMSHRLDRAQPQQALVMRWIPVRDARGRTVMESCWVRASEVAVATAAPAITADMTLVVHAA